MKYFSLIFLFVFNAGTLGLHDFHLSKCIVEFNAEQEMIQISMQLFIDDLEMALEGKGVEKQFIGTEKELDSSDEHIAKYLNERFTIEINKTEQGPLKFLGKEVSEDLTSIWCYMEILNISELSELNVKNGILQETYSDQKNIVKIIGPKGQVSHFLSQIGNNEKSILYKDE